MINFPNRPHARSVDYDKSINKLIIGRQRWNVYKLITTTKLQIKSYRTIKKKGSYNDEFNQNLIIQLNLC